MCQNILNLGGYKLSDEDVSALAEALKTNTSLEHLVLCRNKIEAGRQELERVCGEKSIQLLL